MHVIFLPHFFLARVVQDRHYNKMSFNNLSLVFGPTLIRPKPDQIKYIHVIQNPVHVHTVGDK